MKKTSKLNTARILALSVVLALTLLVSTYSAGAQGQSNAAEIREKAQSKAEDASIAVDERKAEIMAMVEARKEEVKQQTCERRQATLDRVMTRLPNSANTVMNRINTMYDRVVGFYEKGQLTVDNYDELVLDIETAKANAEQAVEAIGEFEFELDCENAKVGEQLDGFRTAIKEARTEIKAYREALVELISSLRAEAASNSDDSGDDSSDESAEEEDNEQ